MTDHLTPTATTYIPPKLPSLTTKISIGAALLAVPLGSALVYLHLKDVAQFKNIAEEKALAFDGDVARIDPAIIKYELTSQIPTGLKYARALAFDPDGRLLVAGDRKVRVLDNIGSLLNEFNLRDYPACIAASRSIIYVGFRDHVETFSPDGKLLKAWPSLGGRSQLTGLATGGEEVYIADAGRRLVERRDLEGNLLGTVGQRDDSKAAPGLILPSPYLNVAQSADGKLLVSDPGRHRIETYALDGELRNFFGTAGANIAGFIGCCNPSHFALMTDGRVVTAEKGAGRIKVYSQDGKLDAVVAGPDVIGNGQHGFEIAVDIQNRIFVLEPGATNIKIFSPISVSTAGVP